MDLRGPLARAGVARPEVFLTSCPGATEVRLAAEREARVRGWRLAAAPAASNLLVVAGVPAAGAASWTDGVWQQIPEPKARADLLEAAAVGAVFDDARQRLRRRAGGRRGPEQNRAEPDARGPGMGAMRPEAEPADDRDGLRLDQVHVPLGPALPDWPAGLILHVALQGDVVQHASVERRAGVARQCGSVLGRALARRPSRSSGARGCRGAAAVRRASGQRGPAAGGGGLA